MVTKYYELDETGHIALTADSGGTDEFDFPDDFDFREQNYFQISGGRLIEDTEKREAEEAARREAEREAGRMEAQLLYTALMTDTLLEV